MSQPYDEHPVTPPVTADGAVADEVRTADGFGDPRVDEALRRLDDLAERPVGEHAEVFDDVHERLRGALEEAAAAEPAEETRG